MIEFKTLAKNCQDSYHFMSCKVTLAIMGFA